MRRINIETARTDDDNEFYCATLCLKVYHVCIIMTKDYDEDEPLGFNTIIALKKDTMPVHSMRIDNELITIRDFEIFLDDLKHTSVCPSCDFFFQNADKVKVCDDCYPYMMEQKEDCSICLSNKEAVWIETRCKHVFHLSCFKKIHQCYHNGLHFRKCPLCRKEVTIDCYEKL
jgi:hypothetical protein